MSKIGFPCSENWRRRMYKKMVNPLAHGVSKHHLLKETPESKPSDEVSRLSVVLGRMSISSFFSGICKSYFSLKEDGGGPWDTDK